MARLVRAFLLVSFVAWVPACEPDEPGDGGNHSAGASTGGAGLHGGSGGEPTQAGSSGAPRGGSAGAAGSRNASQGGSNTSGEAGSHEPDTGDAGDQSTGAGGTSTNGGSSGHRGGSPGGGLGGSGGSSSGEAGESGASGATPNSGGTAGGDGGTGIGGTGIGGTGTGGTGNVGTGATSGSCETDGAIRPCCQGGTQACVAGSWESCSGEIPSGESCNGIDDDCDGEVDELGTFTCGVGACTTTVSACNSNGVSACIPAQPTTSVDSCNGIDDDCDGAVDEDCATCLHVTTSGNDSAAAASNGASPFLTVHAALDFADTHRDVATRVCVAPGPACGASATFSGPTGADLTMRDGIALLANYESTTWKRCASSTTHLAAGTGTGVLFPAAAANPTVLDGFAIDRFAADTTAGVTIDGAHGALLSNLTIVGSSPATTVYGVRLTNGAQASIFRSRIDSGVQCLNCFGVHSVGSQVRIEDACPTAVDPTTGRCAVTFPDSAGCPTSGAAIIGEGRTWEIGASPLPYQVVAVWLESSPGSRIERSAVCTSLNPQTAVDSDSGAIRVLGDASGLIVRGDSVQLYSPATSLGTGTQDVIRMSECGGAAPWVVNNAGLAAQAGDRFKAVVHAVGDCHPTIEANQRIHARTHYWSQSSAVACEAASGAAARCTVTNNPRIEHVSESTGSQPPQNPSFNTTGVRCTGGSCTRIDDNDILGGDGYGLPITATGVSLEAASVLVAHNRITGRGSQLPTGGFALRAQSGVGIAFSGGARIVDNVILGMDYALDYQPSFHFRAVAAFATATNGSFELASNDLRAVASPLCGTGWLCNGTGDYVHGVVFSGTAGVVEDNFIFGGLCGASWDTSNPSSAFAEFHPGEHPELFENNELLATALYLDEGNTPLTDPAAIDALTDMTASGTTAYACSTSGSAP